MQNTFPVQPVPVATTIKQLFDQVQACKHWIDATARHDLTLIFRATVHGIDQMHLVKINELMLHDLSPGTRAHLDKFFQSLADEQCSKKLLLEHQQSPINSTNGKK